MGAEVELHKLVDLALRTPDGGVVNFNHLHTLLHAILNHIGLSYDPRSGVLKPQKTASDEENDKTTTTEQSGVSYSDQQETEVSYPTENHPAVPEQPSPPNGSYYDSLQSRHENLEKKVQELEDRLKVLDELPSNRMIIEQAKQADNSNQETATNNHGLAGIWQFMKINSRLQASEAAIDRVMSILNEFLGSGGKTVKELGSEMGDLAAELKHLKEHILGRDTTHSQYPEEHGSSGPVNEVDYNRMDKFVTKDDLLLYVKWPALEKALNVKKSYISKGIKDNGDQEKTLLVNEDDYRQASDAESDGRPQSAPVQSTSQTPVDNLEVPKTAFARSPQVNSPELLAVMDHPSEEMVECLKQIGELSDKHNTVVKNVASIAESQQEIAGELARVEETLPQKANKEELNIPDDLQDQLAMLKQGLEFLNTNQDLVAIAEIKKKALDNKEHIESIKRELAMIARQSKPAFTGISTPSPSSGVDNSVLDAIRGHLDELQTEQEKFVVQTEGKQAEAVEDLNRKQDHIEALYSYVEKLQESKADKENVAMEMNIKADKAALDSKVNVSTFDNTFNMLDEGIREALQKMDDYMNEEMALKQALKQLSLDMSEKMDGQAFQALKNYLERRIADVQKSRSMIAAETRVDFSDAAGFRKSIKLNCISCSRPVELPVKGPTMPNMPVPRGVRTKRSKAPYLSYEMDQIRQYQRGHYSGTKQDKTLNDIVSGRPCGGSHTVMYHPKKRSTRATQLNQVIARDDGPEIPNWARELSVVDFLKGSDGLVYKGRFKQTIPPIAKGFQSAAHEHEFSPLAKEESQYTSSRSHSEPSSPREAHGQPEQENYRERKSSPRETQQENGQRPTTSPRTRMRHIVKRHSSDSPPGPVPSPSPPTVRENEFHQASQKQQKQDVTIQESPSKLFCPVAPRSTPAEETGPSEATDLSGYEILDQSRVSERVTSPTRGETGDEQTREGAKSRDT